jgi:hypothetical protein
MSVSSEQASQEPWGWESPAGAQANVPQRGYTKAQMQEAIQAEVEAEKQKHLATLYACVGFFFVGIVLGFMAFHYSSKARAAGKKVGWAVYVLAVADVLIGAVQANNFFREVVPGILAWWASTH